MMSPSRPAPSAPSTIQCKADDDAVPNFDQENPGRTAERPANTRPHVVVVADGSIDETPPPSFVAVARIVFAGVTDVTLLKRGTAGAATNFLDGEKSKRKAKKARSATATAAETYSMTRQKRAKTPSSASVPGRQSAFSISEVSLKTPASTISSMSETSANSAATSHLNTSKQPTAYRRLTAKDLVNLDVEDELIIVIPQAVDCKPINDVELKRAAEILNNKREKLTTRLSRIIADNHVCNTAERGDLVKNVLDDNHAVLREGKTFLEFGCRVASYANRSDILTNQLGTADKVDLWWKQNSGVGISFDGYKLKIPFTLQWNEMDCIEGSGEFISRRE
ncbi:hypothetical protein THAOC_08705 [Thalassiosira oceanica]|uniref:Uncharacterized protein n=1 Tax=Thalassiosira oceanica TaxID=159749 RepID=K0SYC0_THAOC|nr:hypothetical protein THAOC_08705 [Thalassiosira oceanica]|eukprot:EJK69979.1 hypothetical protein THAOC_08705 [Thalassiosira oceanica]